MTWPFENDMDAIITKLAKKNLSADKRRNVLIAAAIILATCLIVATALYFFYTQRSSLNDAEGRYQAIFTDLEMDAVEELQKDSRLQVGASYLLGMISYGDYKLTVRTMDEQLIRLAKYPAMNGRLPENINEVAITQAFLAKAEISVGVGGTITLDLGNGSQQFSVCGILPVETSNYSLYVSDAFVRELITEPLYSAYINVPDTNGWSKAAIQGEISSIGAQYGLKQQQIQYSTYYFSLIQQRSSQYVTVIAVVGIVVALAAALVIYSLFYVSIIHKTNEYGKLRTIGTTAKQVKHIVYREGRRLSFIGIPCGVILGEISGFALVPDGWSLPAALAVGLAAAVFMYFTIAVAVNRPAQIAAQVTPIEALRYSANCKEVFSKSTKKLHRPLSTIRLAILNFIRNKKKTALTVCSLGVCGILLMGSSAFFNSIDPLNMARQNFPYGEIEVELGSYGAQMYNSTQYYDVQRENMLTDEILRAIKDIDGVIGVKEYTGAVLDFHIPTGYIEPFIVDGVSEDSQALLNEYLLAGTADLQEISKNNGILLTDAQWSDIFGWDVSIGEEIKVDLPNGAVTTRKIMGIVDANIPYGGNNMVFVPIDTLYELMGLNNLTYQFVIDTDDAEWETVKEQVQKLFPNAGGVYVTTLDNWREAFQEKMTAYRTPVYMFVLFIGVFGIINLLNTLVTNVLTRRRELGILQAVGAGGKQLSKMLLAEGLLYTFGAAILSITLGTLVGCLMCHVFSSMSVFGAVEYHFPIFEMLAYFIVMLVIQMVFSILTIRQIKKQSLVDQIRELA